VIFFVGRATAPVNTESISTPPVLGSKHLRVPARLRRDANKSRFKTLMPVVDRAVDETIGCLETNVLLLFRAQVASSV
jgi:hypothetical protein